MWSEGQNLAAVDEASTWDASQLRERGAGDASNKAILGMPERARQALGVETVLQLLACVERPCPLSSLLLYAFVQPVGREVYVKPQGMIGWVLVHQKEGRVAENKQVLLCSVGDSLPGTATAVLHWSASQLSAG